MPRANSWASALRFCKRPVVWFDELVITLPFDPEAGDTATAIP